MSASSSKVSYAAIAAKGSASTAATVFGTSASPPPASSTPTPASTSASSATVTEPTYSTPSAGGGARDARPKQVSVKNSKALTSALRHQAQELGLAIRSDGFVRLRELLAHPKYRHLTRADVIAIVDQCQKRRFELRDIDGDTFIRATQGHTMTAVEEEGLLEAITDPSTVPVCVHGTYRRCIDAIRSTGLNKMARNHIHMAIDLPGSGTVVSGARSSVEVLVFVDIRQAMADGIPFYRSTNGVILSPGLGSTGSIPPKYFAEVRFIR